MTTWSKVNTWAGYLVFGVPTAFAVLALTATGIRFGVWDTVVHAVVPAVLVTMPLLLWIRYVAHRPTKPCQWIGWAMVAMLCLAGTLLSPLWGWAVPSLLLLASEAMLAIAGTARLVTTARARTTKQAAGRPNQPTPTIGKAPRA